LRLFGENLTGRVDETVFRWDVDVHEAVGVGLLDHGPRELHCPVEVGRLRHHLLSSELPQRIFELALLIVQVLKGNTGSNLDFQEIVGMTDQS